MFYPTGFNVYTMLADKILKLEISP